MDWMFNGLPLHILLVHFVVIVVPLAALCVVLSAVWPAARRRLGVVTPIIALSALISVPITVQAGEALEELVKENSLLEIHTEMGDTLLPWAVGLFLVSVVQWCWYHYFANRNARFAGQVTSSTRRVAVTAALAVLVAATAAGSCVTVFQIGESGARASWSDVSSGG